MARHHDATELVYVAISSGVVLLPDGREFAFRQGVTKIKGDHPVMATTCRVNFEPLDVSVGVIDYIKR